MWPQNFLKILVPRTPPDPPLPPLTPPRGPGGPKMAKMHSLKSIDDNLCQKSHFWGVKKIDLFFHSEYTGSRMSCLGNIEVRCGGRVRRKLRENGSWGLLFAHFLISSVHLFSFSLSWSVFCNH